MERSNPEGEPNSTVINASEGNDELNDDGVVNQEGSLRFLKFISLKKMWHTDIASGHVNKVDEITDVMVTRNDELDLRHELPDHSGLSEEKISAIGMRFDSLHLAQEFYAIYAKKLGFVTKVRNTNFNKMWKDTKIPINQSLHCTREGYRESRVKAATRSNRITATRCKARMYVMMDREKECWVVSRVELRHSHPCSAEKVVHYREYRELTMHAKCVITDNDEAGIRPNKMYLALANKVDLYANRCKWVPILFKSEFWAGMRSTQRNESMHAFYGGYLHCKSGLVHFVNEYDNVLGNKKQKELEDDAADSKGVIPCIGSTGIEQQFQQEYTSNMFRTLQLEFDPLSRKSRCECNKFKSVGILCCHILVVWSYYRVDIVPSCYVLPRWSKNVICKHTYIKSSHDVAWSNESHNLFKHLCSEFYNVAQEFVACEEEAAILRAALSDAKSKLTDHRVSMRSTTLDGTQNTMPTRSTYDVILHDIQGPSRVKTKGRPKGKRLGAKLDKSIKKSMEKRKRKSQPDVVELQTDNDRQGSVDNIFEDSTIWNSSYGGGFMDLLNSFRHL
ncbi:Protein FAR1-RELATED SEQUENCE [Arachis hypogaea]|nr:Protein FAR1-RELATED SEQUENCE [Arachis hypogaea]